MTEKDPYRKSGVLLFDPPEDAEPQKQEWMGTADVHCLRSEEHMGYDVYDDAREMIEREGQESYQSESLERESLYESHRKWNRETITVNNVGWDVGHAAEVTAGTRSERDKLENGFIDVQADAEENAIKSPFVTERIHADRISTFTTTEVLDNGNWYQNDDVPSKGERHKSPSVIHTEKLKKEHDDQQEKQQQETPTVLTKLQKWADYPSVGDPVRPTLFLPMKTPMSLEIINNWTLPSPPKHSLTVPELIRGQKKLNRTVGMIIDLANHECLYADDIPEEIQYAHIQLVAKVLPPRESIDEVQRVAEMFWRQFPDHHIAIHCAYGFNRTGFVVCSYLCQACGMSVEEALESFKLSRPPGVKHGKFVEELYARYGNPKLDKSITENQDMPTGEHTTKHQAQIRVKDEDSTEHRSSLEIANRECRSYDNPGSESKNGNCMSAHGPRERNLVLRNKELSNGANYGSDLLDGNKVFAKSCGCLNQVIVENDNAKALIFETDDLNDVSEKSSRNSRLQNGEESATNRTDWKHKDICSQRDSTSCSFPIPIERAGSDSLTSRQQSPSIAMNAKRPSLDAWISHRGTNQEDNNRNLGLNPAFAFSGRSSHFEGSGASNESEVSLLAERLDARGMLRRETSLNLARALHEDFGVSGSTPNHREKSPIAEMLSFEEEMKETLVWKADQVTCIDDALKSNINAHNTSRHEDLPPETDSIGYSTDNLMNRSASCVSDNPSIGLSGPELMSYLAGSWHKSQKETSPKLVKQSKDAYFAGNIEENRMKDVNTNARYISSQEGKDVQNSHGKSCDNQATNRKQDVTVNQKQCILM